MAQKNVSKDIDLKIINDADLLKLFTELTTTVQNKIVYAGFRKAGKLILDEVKNNFQQYKKNSSKSEYASLTKSLKQEDIKNQRTDQIGMKVGIKGNDGYKYRWIESGTKQRETKGKGKGKAKHSTGKMVATNFFDEAVKSTKDKAQDELNGCIMKSFEQTIKKYNKS